MDGNPQGSATNSASRDARARVLAARTKRIRKRSKPLDDIDAEVIALVRRLTPPDDQPLSVNTARAIGQLLTLRKEIVLARFKSEELEYRLEEARAREELETLKDELRGHGVDLS
jgi:hypothetical protein